MIDESKRITEPGECRGKTVESVSCKWGRMALHFTDGTFAFVLAEVYDEYDATIQWDEDLTDDARVFLGIMSKAAFEENDKREREAQRRAEYERLKAEFEAKP